MIWTNNRLRLIVTADCNLNCFYCHNEGQPKSMNLISDSLVKRVFNIMDHTGEKPSAITFTGGEALLHPRLEYYVEEASKYCQKIAVVTNGLLLNRSRLNSLVSAGTFKFRVGVDSLRKYSRPSAGKKQADSIKKILTLLLSEKVNFELNVVLTQFNVRELKQLLTFCKENKISAKFFEHVTVDAFGFDHNKAQIHSEPLVPLQSFIDAVFNVMHDVTSENSLDLGSANIVYTSHSSGVRIRYCHYLCDYKLCYMTGTRIDSTGFVYVCMSKRGFYKISSEEPISQSLSTIKLAVKDGCLPAEV